MSALMPDVMDTPLLSGERSTALPLKSVRRTCTRPYPVASVQACSLHDAKKAGKHHTAVGVTMLPEARYWGTRKERTRLYTTAIFQSFLGLQPLCVQGPLLVSSPLLVITGLKGNLVLERNPQGP